MTTAPPADTLAKDGAAPSTAAAIALDSRSPKRIAGQFEIRVEDLAVYPALESVLSETIRGALQNELDDGSFHRRGGRVERAVHASGRRGNRDRDRNLSRRVSPGSRR